MLLYYAHLQQKMLHRRFQELGIAPIIAYILLILVFITLSFFLFLKTEEYAPYIYVFVAIASIYKWSETNRNDFLLSVFTEKNYRIIRFIENTLLSLPFIAFLCFKNEFLMGGYLLIATNILALIRIRKGSFFTMPTPFYRYPFEFTVGFRRTWLFLLVLYALAVVGVSVANPNLSLVCLGGCGLLAMFFCSSLEPDFYIWIFATDPADFLIKKVNMAHFYTIILGFPISLLLFCYDTSLVYMIVAAIGLSCWGVWIVVYAKYAAYPHEISLPTTFLLLLCFMFPPFLLFGVPFFYNRAIKRLGGIL